jgi:plastocyanin
LLAHAGAVVLAGIAQPARAAPRTHQVTIKGLLNVPEELVVKRGDSVVWTNADPFPHTVTAAGAFDSGPIAAGKSWRLVTRRAGVYPYVCTLHSNMKGTLRVED